MEQGVRGRLVSRTRSASNSSPTTPPGVPMKPAVRRCAGSLITTMVRSRLASRVDPRTGEILDADITMGNGWVTLPRRRVEVQYRARCGNRTLTAVRRWRPGCRRCRPYPGLASATRPRRQRRCRLRAVPTVNRRLPGQLRAGSAGAAWRRSAGPKGPSVSCMPR